MAMPAAKEVRPFLFDRSFDDPNRDSARKKRAAEEEAKKAAEEELQAAEPEAPSFSEEELEAAKAAARAEGHAEGFAEGRAEAEAEAEADIAKSMEILTHEVARLGERQVYANEQQEAALARVTKEILSRLMPVYVRAHGTAEAVDLVEGCLASLHDTGRLTVRCHARDADRIDALLKQATEQTAFEGTIRIIPDDGFGPTDISANWGAGGAQRRYEEIWSGIEDAVETAIATVEARLREAGFITDPPAESEHPSEDVPAKASETMMGPTEEPTDPDTIETEAMSEAGPETTPEREAPGDESDNALSADDGLSVAHDGPPDMPSEPREEPKADLPEDDKAPIGDGGGDPNTAVEPDMNGAPDDSNTLETAPGPDMNTESDEPETKEGA